MLTPQLLLLLAVTATTHPLDDLSRDELAAAVAAIRADSRFGPDARFPIVMAKEPPKAAMLAFKSGGPRPPREAFAAIFEPSRNRFSEVTVDLAKQAISDVKVLAGMQPSILLEEFGQVAEIARKDPRWIEAVKKRGLDPAEVMVDSWAPGLLTPAERATGHRLMRGLSYLRGTYDNFYARPVEGLIVTVDLNDKKVLEVLDEGVQPVSRVNADFDEKSIGKQRTGLKPVQTSWPKGVSFKVQGQQITWEGWSLRVSMQPHKGLNIFDVTYEEEPGRPRSILYKGGLSEMVVPYGDPRRSWAFRNAFDVGEYGLGRTMHTLDPLVDTPAGAVFFDALFADDDGKPMEIPRAVAVYERDAGVLWSHMNYETRAKQTRRARELVVTFTTTIGNYDYGVDWIFHLDGTIEVEAFLTGILLAQGSELVDNPCTSDCKRLVAKEIIAPNHQHFFNFRLDLDVDGAADNTPYETNVSADPLGPKNPNANAFTSVQTALKKERAAVRDLSLANARKWKVSSTTKTNALGHPTGYMLVPGEAATPYLDKSSPIRQRAQFIEHAAWFTRYKDAEQSAAGDYPNQSAPGDGLPRFVADDEPLEGSDVVLWYSFGVTHVPRPEEWPIMNAHRTSFKLMPMNFFAKNPAMNVPAVPAAAVKKALRAGR